MGKELRECAACGGPRWHVTWKKSNSVERKCHGCGRLTMEVLDGRAPTAPLRQWNQMEKEARAGLRKASAGARRQGRAVKGMAFERPGRRARPEISVEDRAAWGRMKREAAEMDREWRERAAQIGPDDDPF